MYITSRAAPRNPDAQPPKRGERSQDQNPTWRIALRRQRQIQQLCRTPRLVYEFIDELDRHHNLGEDLDRRLERYASLDVGILQALGADRFPLSGPLRIVGGDR